MYSYTKATHFRHLLQCSSRQAEALAAVHDYLRQQRVPITMQRVANYVQAWSQRADAHDALERVLRPMREAQPAVWRCLDTAHLHWTPQRHRCFNRAFRERVDALRRCAADPRSALSRLPQHCLRRVIRQLARLEAVRVT